LPDSDYGFGARLLHRIALGSPLIGQACFDLENSLQKAASTRADPHVFVTGLARAGTTILLRALDETGRFRSLTYRDMPFVLMPGTWQRLSKNFRQHRAATERAHGDRIRVNYDSPEALEEVFWRTFCGKDYIFRDHLAPHAVDADTLEAFVRYVDHIVASAEEPAQVRYLSKNNNNLLRLAVLRRAFPNAVILIPFRDPLQHANSLLEQQQRFTLRHREDRFAYDYMRWLAHHEFGLTHRPFRFRADEPAPASAGTPDDINYWLQLWCNAYRYVLDNLGPGMLPVCYETLCADPAATLNPILARAAVDVAAESLHTRFSASPEKPVDGVDKTLESQATTLYAQLSRTGNTTAT
jgi:hypothetical protein